MSSDHVEQAQAIPGSVHPKPQLTYAGTDSDISVELVDIESQGLSDIDGILVESQTIQQSWLKHKTLQLSWQHQQRQSLQ